MIGHSLIGYVIVVNSDVAFGVLCLCVISFAFMK